MEAALGERQGRVIMRSAATGTYAAYRIFHYYEFEVI
jgi:hypothetical protein